MHPQHPTTYPLQTRRQRGLTLIELMVAMVIGLFLIGGVIGVFIANQQTSTAKQNLDLAQENFRFGSHTLMRVMRQGIGFDPASTSTELIVNLVGGAGSHDCVGNISGGTNTLFVDEQNRLMCTDDSDVNHVLMGDVTALNVLFAVDGIDGSSCGETIVPADQDALLANDEFVDSDCVQASLCENATGVVESCWPHVRAARATLTLVGGQQLPFTATMRPMVVATLGTSVTDGSDGMPDGGNETPPSEPGNSDEPAEPTDPPEQPTDPSQPTDPQQPSDPPTTPPITTISCNCFYKNKEGHTLTGTNNDKCTANCCSEFAPSGIKNNQGYGITVPLPNACTAS